MAEGGLPPVRGYNCGHILARESLIRNVEHYLEEARTVYQDRRDQDPTLPLSLPGANVIRCFERAGIYCVQCHMYLTRTPFVKSITQTRRERYKDSENITVLDEQGPDTTRVYAAR